MQPVIQNNFYVVRSQLMYQLSLSGSRFVPRLLCSLLNTMDILNEVDDFTTIPPFIIIPAYQ